MQRLDILMVDDNDDDVFMVREVASHIGCYEMAHVARDGQEALDFLLGCLERGEGSLPDMVLLDINMPRRNGFEVLAAMKSHPGLRHIPVVIFTSSPRDEDVQRAYAEGACSYVHKPVGFESMVRLARGFTHYWTDVSRLPSVSLSDTGAV